MKNNNVIGRIFKVIINDDNVMEHTVILPFTANGGNYEDKEEELLSRYGLYASVWCYERVDENSPLFTPLSGVTNHYIPSEEARAKIDEIEDICGGIDGLVREARDTVEDLISDIIEELYNGEILEISEMTREEFYNLIPDEERQWAEE